MSWHGSFLPRAWHQGFLERIADCNRHDLERYRPLVLAGSDPAADGRPIGALRTDRLPLVETLALSSGVDGWQLPAESIDARSARFAATVEVLAERAAIRPPTGERYPVGSDIAGPAVAVVDRAAVAFFGVAAAGVHVNGFTRRGDGIAMWIAVRSRTKATFPGRLDNLVAGGQGADIGRFENLVKECGEEAGIAPELARTARPVSTVRYVFEDETGLKPDTMFCFDLELPPEFVPEPADGEVERFELWSVAEVAERVATTRDFKFNCNLVVIDFLLRHGWLDPDDPAWPRLVDGLHSGAPRFPTRTTD